MDITTLPAPEAATLATGDDLPSSPTCPLHGTSCEAWK